eukprot:Polyplicarium_translucidae@DN3995_c0_g1_i1.p1
MKRSVAISLVDHTSLNASDDDAAVTQLLEGAASTWPEIPYAVCVFPQFVKTCRDVQDRNPRARAVRVATVVNFPLGRDGIEKAQADAAAAIREGADELDLVIDYELLKENAATGRKAATDLIRAVKSTCPRQAVLKVIIETGELKEAALIKEACEACYDGGADFIKTSTGKRPISATPEAVATVLEVIAANRSRRPMGLKIAGGVRAAADVDSYEKLVCEKMGQDWIGPGSLRFGSSSLLNALRVGGQGDPQQY